MGDIERVYGHEVGNGDDVRVIGECVTVRLMVRVTVIVCVGVT